MGITSPIWNAHGDFRHFNSTWTRGLVCAVRGTLAARKIDVMSQRMIMVETAGRAIVSIS